DNWFRPVNLANGPDGALYVCDMYRKTIEHPDYLPEASRKITDFDSGKTNGRIYRVVADPQDGGTRTALSAQSHLKKPKKFDLSKSSTKELCDLFNNPNIWWRMTAQRLLLERQDEKAAHYLNDIAAKGKTPEARVHALRTLEGLGALSNNEIVV